MRASLVICVMGAAPSAQALRADLRSMPSTIAPAETALVGTIERFEAQQRQLVLSTREGHVTFVVAADAVVRMGSRTLSAADLSNHKGRQAKVRYTERGGTRTAHWVVISSDSPRTAE